LEIDVFDAGQRVVGCFEAWLPSIESAVYPQLFLISGKHLRIGNINTVCFRILYYTQRIEKAIVDGGAADTDE
jgi:hypothetical protein